MVLTGESDISNNNEDRMSVNDGQLDYQLNDAINTSFNQ